MLGLLSPAGALTAAANLLDATVRGGLADTRRMPSAPIDEGPLRRVHRYLSLGEAKPVTSPLGARQSGRRRRGAGAA